MAQTFNIGWQHPISSQQKQVEILHKLINKLKSVSDMMFEDNNNVNNISNNGFRHTMLTILKDSGVDFNPENIEKYYSVFQPWKETSHCREYQQYVWQRPSHYYDDYAAGCIKQIISAMR